MLANGIIHSTAAYSRHIFWRTKPFYLNISTPHLDHLFKWNLTLSTFLKLVTLCLWKWQVDRTGQQIEKPSINYPVQHRWHCNNSLGRPFIHTPTSSLVHPSVAATEWACHHLTLKRLSIPTKMKTFHSRCHGNHLPSLVQSTVEGGKIGAFEIFWKKFNGSRWICWDNYSLHGRCLIREKSFIRK